MSKAKWQEVLLMVGGFILLWMALDNIQKKSTIKMLEEKLDEANELSKEVKIKL